MSQYTVLGHADISKLASIFIEEKITSFSLLSGGSQNTNYRIHATSDSYVLSICEGKSIEETENLVHILEHLASHSFSTSLVVRTIDNRPFTTWEGKPVMLKQYLEGKILDKLPAHLLEMCGKNLAILHKVPVPDYVSDRVSFGVEKFIEVKEYAPDSDFHKWLDNIRQQIENALLPDLPRTLIHSDVFNNNVIINDDETTATIMDFEDVCQYYRIFDIGMMIVGLCCHNRIIDLVAVQSILSGYQSETELLSIEKERLQTFTIYAAAATAFWRHRQFNQIQIVEGKRDRYKEMQEIANYVSEVPSQSFMALFLTP